MPSRGWRPVATGSDVAVDPSSPYTVPPRSWRRVGMMTTGGPRSLCGDGKTRGAGGHCGRDRNGGRALDARASTPSYRDGGAGQSRSRSRAWPRPPAGGGAERGTRCSIKRSARGAEPGLNKGDRPCAESPRDTCARCFRGGWSRRPQAAASCSHRNQRRRRCAMAEPSGTPLGRTLAGAGAAQRTEQVRRAWPIGDGLARSRDDWSDA